MNKGSAIFIFIDATAIVCLLGLPLLISPMTWARKVGWEIPEQKDLANYFGRSLGAVGFGDRGFGLYGGVRSVAIPGCFRSRNLARNLSLRRSRLRIYQKKSTGI